MVRSINQNLEFVKKKYSGRTFFDSEIASVNSLTRIF